MDESSDRRASLERDGAAYDRLLAGLRAFTLQRQVRPQAPERHYRRLDVYRSEDPGEISELRGLLAARASGRHCMCIGSDAISLQSGAASAVLTLHHGISVRWWAAGWGDFELERGRELAEWLAARGLPGSRDEMDRSERDAAQVLARQQAWIAAMPAALLPDQEAILGLMRTGAGPSPELLGQLSKALSDAESDDARRIRAVLSWHASGSGRWSPYPVYEDLPEMLLLAEAPQVLRVVLSAHDLTAAELAGAARLVASGAARNRAEFNDLPAAAWDRLIAAVAADDDEDKRGWLARRRAESERS